MEADISHIDDIEYVLTWHTAFSLSNDQRTDRIFQKKMTSFYNLITWPIPVEMLMQLELKILYVILYVPFFSGIEMSFTRK